MTLNIEELEKKIAALEGPDGEILTYARNAQQEINAIQKAAQDKVIAAQKHVDNLEGKVEALKELLAQLKGPVPAAPETLEAVTTPDENLPVED